MLIEHYAGAFPLWLAPVQAVVLPIADRHVGLCAQVRRRLGAAGLRAELDDRQEKIGYKIRDAQLQKIPYMLVTGDREAAEGAVAVRSARRRRSGQRGRATSSSPRRSTRCARVANEGQPGHRLAGRTTEEASYRIRT